MRTETVSAEMDVYTLIGLNIRKRRRELKLKQLDVANEAYLNRGSLCQIELGKHKPSMDLLIRIADSLKCSVFALLAGIDQFQENHKQ